MKKIIALVFIGLFLSNSIKADVIYSPHTNKGVVLSLEFIGSYEFLFSRKHSLNLWAGIGAVSTFDLSNPAYGAEIAIELRHYFKKDSFDGFNLGLYSGLAYMSYPSFYRGKVVRRDRSVGFVPGIKITYKKRLNPWLVGEPYLSLSTPFYEDDFKEMFQDFSEADSGIIFTLGLRLGFNTLKIKK